MSHKKLNPVINCRMRYKMRYFKITVFLIAVFIGSLKLSGQKLIQPADIEFVRQGVQRMVFSPDQSILLSEFNPSNIVGIRTMHPQTTYGVDSANVSVNSGLLILKSQKPSETAFWLGGFNPFATYSLHLATLKGQGAVGFEFADAQSSERFQVFVRFKSGRLNDVVLKIIRNKVVVREQSILTNSLEEVNLPGEIIVQMIGSGLNVFIKEKGLPIAIAQADFNETLDLRKFEVIHTFQSRLLFILDNGEIVISDARSALTTGVGQADIRVITHKDGSPFIDQGRIWYTLSIRGRALPHHLQGVFSLNPSVFDLKFEGIVVFDRKDGLLRNEISSHLFYDDDDKIWRGFTTGFTFAANPKAEKKQIWAVESQHDPRFGFSVMQAKSTNIVGDIEDSHIIYDASVKKWRILTCENIGKGYNAVILESNTWDGFYKRIAGPVRENSTGTSMLKMNNKWFCLSGSSERKIFIYTYPDLKPAGTLKMDLPPWDDKAGTRVWPNVVALPDGFSEKYVALMMDRYNYPGLKGPNWSYGALYLYYGYLPNPGSSN